MDLDGDDSMIWLNQTLMFFLSKKTPTDCLFSLPEQWHESGACKRGDGNIVGEMMQLVNLIGGDMWLLEDI